MSKIYFFIFFYSVVASAQWKQEKIIKEKSMVTGQENEWRIRGRDAIVKRDSGSRYIQIHIRETKDVLYGNRCAEMEAQKMRIEFIIIPKDIGFGMKLRNFFGVNLNAHAKAFFRNGFFWQKRLRKRIKKCRDATGDYIR
ncbi:MAG: hypothetical protein OHK0045_05270 [Raineya sp.]